MTTAAELGVKAKESLDYFALVAARAHSSWLPAVPAPLFERALRSRDGSKLVSRWLAFQLQLEMPAMPTLTEHERWLLSSRDVYAGLACELGATLSSAWIRTQVSRQSVARIQQALGDKHDKQFANAISISPLQSAANPVLVAALERAASVDELRSTVEACGAHALQQTLPNDDRKLVARFRLAFIKRWPEYDALEGMRADPSFVQHWLQTAPGSNEEDGRVSSVAKRAVGDSQ
jgi:hypothetical protein